MEDLTSTFASMAVTHQQPQSLSVFEVDLPPLSESFGSFQFSPEVENAAAASTTMTTGAEKEKDEELVIAFALGNVTVFGFRLRVPFGLYPHQERAIRWQIECEEAPRFGICGGVASLGMGLGKTLVSYCVIASEPGLTQSRAERRPTLVLVNKSLLGQFVMEKERFFGKQLSILVYFREKMDRKSQYDKMTAHVMRSKDIVITTYDALVSAGKKAGIVREKKKKKQAGAGAAALIPKQTQTTFATVIGQNGKPLTEPCGSQLLFSIPWFRVVADESQRFANPKSILFQVMCRLRAERKMCLTGTPIRNVEVDLWSQLRFCGMTIVDNPKDWSNKQFHALGLRSNVLITTYESAGIVLPPMTKTNVSVRLSDEERQLYKMFLQLNQQTFLAFRHGRINFASVLTMFLRLRQVCIAPYLICPESSMVFSKLTQTKPEEAKRLLEMPVLGNFVPPSQSGAFGFTNNQAGGGGAQEGMNAKEMTEEEKMILEKEKRIAEKLVLMEGWLRLREGTSGVRSAKNLKIIDMLESEVDITEKIVVFSDFAAALVLLEQALKEHSNAKYHGKWRTTVRLDGSMKGDERDRLIESFKNPHSDVNVLLLTYKLGSEGLNLTQSHVMFFMNPWWCPAVEWQAIARVYRIGQEHPVRIYRLLVENTIEDTVMEAAAAKTEIVTKAFGKRDGDDGENQGLPDHQIPEGAMCPLCLEDLMFEPCLAAQKEEAAFAAASPAERIQLQKEKRKKAKTKTKTKTEEKKKEKKTAPIVAAEKCFVTGITFEDCHFVHETCQRNEKKKTGALTEQLCPVCKQTYDHSVRRMPVPVNGGTSKESGKRGGVMSMDLIGKLLSG